MRAPTRSAWLKRFLIVPVAALAFSSAPWAANPRLAVTTVKPAGGATVSGSITWQVDVSGGTASRVEFAIDGAVSGTDSLAPYLYNGGVLDTTALANGSHTLTATAYADHHRVAKTSVTVTMSNQSSPSQTTEPPSMTTSPVISGLAQVGQTLTASTGSWSGTTSITYAYQWLRCDSGGASCAAIAAATAQTHLLGSGDAASTLRVKVTATNSVGSAFAQSAQTAIVNAGSASTSIYWGAWPGT